MLVVSQMFKAYIILYIKAVWCI